MLVQSLRVKIKKNSCNKLQQLIIFMMKGGAMEKKQLRVRPEAFSDRAHELLNDPTVNKSQLVSMLVDKEAERRGVVVASKEKDVKY